VLSRRALPIVALATAPGRGAVGIVRLSGPALQPLVLALCGRTLVPRVATLLLGIVAVALGITFKGQNVAFMVSLAFALAASANFPALILAIFWRGYTTAGAVTSMVVGAVTTLALIYLSPTIQIDVLGGSEAWFPLKNPALVTVPLSFVAGILVSLLAPERASADGFRALERRMHLGGEW